MAGKTVEKSDTQVEEKQAGNDEVVPKKRGRPAKAAADKDTDKPKAAPKLAKVIEAGQEGKRPRGRPPGHLLAVELVTLLDMVTMICCCAQGLAKSRRQQQRKQLQRMPSKMRCCCTLVGSLSPASEGTSLSPSCNACRQH